MSVFAMRSTERMQVFVLFCGNIAGRRSWRGCCCYQCHIGKYMLIFYQPGSFFTMTTLWGCHPQSLKSIRVWHSFSQARPKQPLGPESAGRHKRESIVPTDNFRSGRYEVNVKHSSLCCSWKRLINAAQRSKDV